MLRTKKDPDVVKKLKEGTNDSIEYGLDWYVFNVAVVVSKGCNGVLC